MTSQALSEDERFDRLRLARTERVGPVAFAHLLKRFGSAAQVLDALPDLTRGPEAVIPPRETIEREIAAGERLGARLLVLGDPDFPPQLAVLDPPPPVLWTRGDVALLSRDSVAIVGARIASAAGQRFARGLAGELGQAGYAVVSGMARGVDAAAHEGSLPTGTIAVLGGGVDDIYPHENRELYARIAAEGCVVSESPVGAKAKAQDFPRRNRIISGLSRAVVVVEAELRSGSLITARLAGEQGREVLAVPGSPLDPRSKGTNDLIRQGAALCEGVDDVLRALSRPYTLPLREPGADFDPSDSDTPEALLNQVRALLSPTPTPLDELVRVTGARAPDVFAALVELSIAGEADLLGGGLACARG
ncbi:MAG: DNA-protecting protein DprA [Proteobacteria bacterium]|nr:DNA-protecting protein DprA [Pseudomonadota bacterium]